MNEFSSKSWGYFRISFEALAIIHIFMANFSKAHKGIYIPKNPQKWVITKRGLGEGKIVYRSSLEKRFMIYADLHPDIVKIASEELKIPYVSPIDKKPHTYYIDFWLLVKTKDGKYQEVWVEIKPEQYTKPNFMKRRNKKTKIEEAKLYAVNQAKWNAAQQAASKKGAKFVIITEKDLKGIYE